MLFATSSDRQQDQSHCISGRFALFSTANWGKAHHRRVAMALFDGKKGLILGVANENSIAWAIAKQILSEGGLCGFSHLPDRPDDERQRNRRRVSQLTDAQPNAKFLAPLDVSKDVDIDTFMSLAAKEFGKIDFLLHSIAFANTDDLAKPTLETSSHGYKLA